MNFRKRDRGPSKEALAALAKAHAMADQTNELIKRANVISSKLEAHKQSNGFAELVAEMYAAKR